MMLAFVGVGSTQLIFLAIVMLLLFGHRLPETMRNLGKGMNEFKKGMKEGEQDEDEQHRVEEK